MAAPLAKWSCRLPASMPFSSGSNQALGRGAMTVTFDPRRVGMDMISFLWPSRPGACSPLLYRCALGASRLGASVPEDNVGQQFGMDVNFPVVVNQAEAA